LELLLHLIGRKPLHFACRDSGVSGCDSLETVRRLLCTLWNSLRHLLGPHAPGTITVSQLVVGLTRSHVQEAERKRSVNFPTNEALPAESGPEMIPPQARKNGGEKRKEDPRSKRPARMNGRRG
jgi:hypothetical protein